LAGIGTVLLPEGDLTTLRNESKLISTNYHKEFQMSVSVVCPCGSSFQRAVKQGRPPVWCPTCKALPEKDRPERSAAQGSDPKPEPLKSRFGSHDPLSYEQREAVEVGCLDVADEYRYRMAEASKAGAGELEKREVSEWYHQALIGVYEEAGVR
jgi:hypothetical protein